MRRTTTFGIGTAAVGAVIMSVISTGVAIASPARATVFGAPPTTASTTASASVSMVASTTVPPRPVLGPAQTIETADGHIQVFAIGDGMIWQNWQDPETGAHGNWVGQPTPLIFAGTPAVVSRPGQPIIDVFARGLEGGAIETWYNWANGKWGGFIGLGGTSVGGGSDPSAIVTPDGHEEVAITSGGLVWSNWFVPSNGRTGAFATTDIPAPSPVVGRPAMVARAGSNCFDVFARTINGNILETWFDYTAAFGSNVGGWIDLGGSTRFDPAAVLTPASVDIYLSAGRPDRDEIIINAGSTVAENWFVPLDGRHGGWIAFVPAPATLTGAPALTPRRGRPQVDIFVRGTNAQTYEEYFDDFSIAIGGWIRLGGLAATPPAAVTTIDANEQVVTTFGNGAAVDRFTPSDGTVSGWRPLQ